MAYSSHGLLRLVGVKWRHLQRLLLWAKANASLERTFTHRPYAYNGINSHTARNKSSVSHIQTIRWEICIVWYILPPDVIIKNILFTHYPLAATAYTDALILPTILLCATASTTVLCTVDSITWCKYTRTACVTSLVCVIPFEQWHHHDHRYMHLTLMSAS